MSNWFKKAIFEHGEGSVQEDISYRVVVPIDIKIPSVGDDFKNRSNAYGVLRSMFDFGEERIRDLHNGIDVMLNFSDIRPRNEGTEQGVPG